MTKLHFGQLFTPPCRGLSHGGVLRRVNHFPLYTYKHLFPLSLDPEYSRVTVDGAIRTAHALCVNYFQYLDLEGVFYLRLAWIFYCIIIIVIILWTQCQQRPSCPYPPIVWLLAGLFVYRKVAMFGYDDGTVAEVTTNLLAGEYERLERDTADPARPKVFQRRVAFLWEGQAFELCTDVGPAHGISVLHRRSEVRE